MPDRSPSEASRAWVETYLPQIGWVGWDPTNNLVAEARYLGLAIRLSI